MLDPALFRQKLDQTAEALAARGYALDTAAIQSLESARKQVQVETQELQARRNALARQIGQLKARGGDASELLAESAAIPERLKALEQRLSEVQAELEAILLRVPNIAQSGVPAGSDERGNVLLRQVGTPPVFDFAVRDHVELGQLHDGLDGERAAKLSGSRFTVLKGPIARLHRALAQFMLDLHTGAHGYTEVNVPLLVLPETMQGTGQLPKFEEDLFRTASEPVRYLIPTSEVPLTNLLRDEIVDGAALPIRMTAHSMCFRAEAGAAGRDTRGMIRQHQFEKVELVQLCRPDQSAAQLDEMTRHAETVLEKLGLAYRTMVLCTGDLGFAAARTHDIEVWLPSQNGYREISSCSNCEAFQTRRMQARFRNEAGKPELLHSLNGSGVAVGRALVAVLENYQQADGSIRVPDVLVPYMGGITQIGGASTL
jgi:seryl-tRNA synthetase